MSDVRKMLAEIRQALDTYPREQLQEILTFVFKEYVVEAGATPEKGALAILEARSELEGLSFAELVTWLQLHLDVPELRQFDVQGGRVSVRAGGRAIPIEVAAAPPVETSAPPPPAPPPPVATPTAPAPQSPTQARTPTQSGSGTGTQSGTGPPSATSADEKKDEEPASRFSWLEVD
jgi:hypothetical protein